MEDEIDYEKLSYGKVAYKRVQRLRRKGKMRGIEVPQLNYELHKPEKPRVAFWIIAIVSLILLIGVLVAAVFLFSALIKLTPMFNDIGDLFKAMFKPELFVVTAGLSAIPAIIAALAIAMLALLCIIPLVLAIFVYRLVRNAIYMAKCSREEFAKGGVISSHITRIIVILAVATVALIAVLIKSPEISMTLVWILYIAVVLVYGGLLALILVEKKKNEKWFETLEEEQKQNYLEHENGMRQVKKRLNREKQSYNTLGWH